MTTTITAIGLDPTNALDQKILTEVDTALFTRILDPSQPLDEVTDEKIATALKQAIWALYRHDGHLRDTGRAPYTITGPKAGAVILDIDAEAEELIVSLGAGITVHADLLGLVGPVRDNCWDLPLTAQPILDGLANAATQALARVGKHLD